MSESNKNKVLVKLMLIVLLQTSIHSMEQQTDLPSVFASENKLSPNFEPSFFQSEKGELIQLRRAAFLELADLYAMGDGGSIDKLKAKDYYEQLIKQADNLKVRAGAYVRLGCLYSFWHDSSLPYERDSSTAIDFFQKAAEQTESSQDQIIAWLALAKMHKQHDGTGSGAFQERLKVAAEYYEKVAEQMGDLEAKAYAQEELALFYYHGRGVTRDFKKAFAFFLLVANQEHNLAQRARALQWIASMYGNGEGVEQDHSKSFDLYVKLAAQETNVQEQAIAFINVAASYEEGHGVPPDYEKARFYYEKAAAQRDDLSAQALGNWRLGHLYLYGLDAKKDVLKAEEYLRKAANQKDNFDVHLKASLGLTEIYMSGEFAQKDYVKARYYCQTVADQTVDRELRVQALKILGDMYLTGLACEGRGFDKDYAKAVSCYEQTLEESDNFYYKHFAVVSLGTIYEKGLGVAQNYERAQELYNKGVGQTQNLKARAAAWFYLGCFYYQSSRNYERATEYLKKAVNQQEDEDIARHSRDYLRRMQKPDEGCTIS